MEPGHHRGERADQVGGRGERGGQTDCRAAAAGHRPDQHGEGTEVDAEQHAQHRDQADGHGLQAHGRRLLQHDSPAGQGQRRDEVEGASSSCPTRQEPP